MYYRYYNVSIRHRQVQGGGREMAVILIRGIGLDKEENEELNNLLRKLNRRRKKQRRNKISYLVHISEKKWYSRDMYQRLYHKKN